MNVESHARPLLAKLRERARQNRRHKIPRRTDAYDEIRSLGRASKIDNLIVDREQAARVTDHHFAVRRQIQCLGAAVEQIAIEQKLQPLDLRAHGRLGNPKQSGRFGKTA